MLCNTLPLIISRHNSFLIAALQLQQKTLSTFHLNYLSTWHTGGKVGMGNVEYGKRGRGKVGMGKVGMGVVPSPFTRYMNL